jgi:hypothetical protein
LKSSSADRSDPAVQNVGCVLFELREQRLSFHIKISATEDIYLKPTIKQLMETKTELDEDLQGLLKALIILVILFGFVLAVLVLFGPELTPV